VLSIEDYGRHIIPGSRVHSLSASSTSSVQEAASFSSLVTIKQLIGFLVDEQKVVFPNCWLTDRDIEIYGVTVQNGKKTTKWKKFSQYTLLPKHSGNIRIRFVPKFRMIIAVRSKKTYDFLQTIPNLSTGFVTYFKRRYFYAKSKIAEISFPLRMPKTWEFQSAEVSSRALEKEEEICINLLPDFQYYFLCQLSLFPVHCDTSFPILHRESLEDFFASIDYQVVCPNQITDPTISQQHELRIIENFFRYYYNQPFSACEKNDIDLLLPLRSNVGAQQMQIEANKTLQKLLVALDDGEINDTTFDLKKNALEVNQWREFYYSGPNNYSGWTRILEHIKEFLTPFSEDDWRTKSARGILLYGPPGTGKTSLLHVIPTTLGMEVLFNGSVADLNEKYVGDGEKRLKTWKEKAECNPYKMFFVGLDEIDSLVSQQEGNRGGNQGHKLDLLKALLQVVGSVANILFIGCTNFKEKLDETFTRANRMSDFILVPACSQKERMAYFKHTFPLLYGYLALRPETSTYLVGATRNFTIAQLLQMEREFLNKCRRENKPQIQLSRTQDLLIDDFQSIMKRNNTNNNNTNNNDTELGLITADTLFSKLKPFNKLAVSSKRENGFFELEEKIKVYNEYLLAVIFKVAQTSALTKGNLATLSQIVWHSTAPEIKETSQIFGDRMKWFSSIIQNNFKYLFDSAQYRNILTGAMFAVVPRGIYGIEIGGNLLFENVIWKLCVGSCSSSIGLSILHAAIELTGADQVYTIDTEFRIKHGEECEKAMRGVVSTCVEHSRLFYGSSSLIVVEVDELIGATVSSKAICDSFGMTKSAGTTVGKTDTESATKGSSWSNAGSTTTAESDALAIGSNWGSSKSSSLSASIATSIGLSGTVGLSVGCMGPSVSGSRTLSFNATTTGTSGSSVTQNTGGSSTKTTSVTKSKGITETVGGNESTTSSSAFNRSIQTSLATQSQQSVTFTKQLQYPKLLHAINLLRRDYDRNLDANYPYFLFLFREILPTDIGFMDELPLMSSEVSQ